MARSRKTSARVARTASKIMKSGNYSRASRRVAASALSQRAPRRAACKRSAPALGKSCMSAVRTALSGATFAQAAAKSPSPGVAAVLRRT
jgi:hypothetical protein